MLNDILKSYKKPRLTDERIWNEEDDVSEAKDKEKERARFMNELDVSESR